MVLFPIHRWSLYVLPAFLVRKPELCGILWSFLILLPFRRSTPRFFPFPDISSFCLFHCRIRSFKSLPRNSHRPRLSNPDRASFIFSSQSCLLAKFGSFWFVAVSLNSQEPRRKKKSINQANSYVAFLGVVLSSLRLIVSSLFFSVARPISFQHRCSLRA